MDKFIGDGEVGGCVVNDYVLNPAASLSTYRFEDDCSGSTPTAPGCRTVVYDLQTS
jgi:hypothetical protein